MSRLFHTSWDTEEPDTPYHVRGTNGSMAMEMDFSEFVSKGEETQMIGDVDIKEDLFNTLTDYSFERGGLASEAPGRNGSRFFSRNMDTPAAIEVLYQGSFKEPHYRDPRGTSTVPDFRKFREQSDGRKHLYAKSFIDDDNYAVPVAVTTPLTIKKSQNKLFYNVKKRLEDGGTFGKSIDSRASAQHSQHSKIPQKFLSTSQVKHLPSASDSTFIGHKSGMSTGPAGAAARSSMLGAKPAKLSELEFASASNASSMSKVAAGMLSARSKVVRDHKQPLPYSSKHTSTSTPIKPGKLPSVELAKSVLSGMRRSTRMSGIVGGARASRPALVGRQTDEDLLPVLSGKKAREVYKNLAIQRGGGIGRPTTASSILANRQVNMSKSGLSSKKSGHRSTYDNAFGPNHARTGAPVYGNRGQSVSLMRKAVKVTAPRAVALEYMSSGRAVNAPTVKPGNTTGGRLWELESKHVDRMNDMDKFREAVPRGSHVAASAPSRQWASGEKDSAMLQREKVGMLPKSVHLGAVKASPVSSRPPVMTMAPGGEPRPRDRLAGASASVLSGSTPASRARASRGVLEPRDN